MTQWLDAPFDQDQVAKLYLEAVELGMAPTHVIREVLDVTPSRASFMARKIRNTDLLGRAPHYPARATIHRNTAKATSFVVCEHCLERWPCPDAYPEGD